MKNILIYLMIFIVSGCSDSVSKKSISESNNSNDYTSISQYSYDKSNEEISDEESSYSHETEKSSSSSSSDETLLAAGLAAAVVVGGLAWLYGAFDSDDDTSTKSGSYEDDVEACNQYYIGRRISIPTGKNNIWGDPIYYSYDIQGIGYHSMTVKMVDSYKVFNLPCSVSRFKPY